MNTREYYELLRYLMEQHCLFPENILFVEDIAAWCRTNGIPETDQERTMKLISKEGPGCSMLIREFIPMETINQRLKALAVRIQLKNVATDIAASLNTDKKKLAYLFLSEFATSLPDIQDELQADDWALNEMERLGFFKQQET